MLDYDKFLLCVVGKTFVNLYPKQSHCILMELSGTNTCTFYCTYPSTLPEAQALNISLLLKTVSNW